MGPIFAAVVSALCPSLDPVVVVDTGAHRLRLCEQGRVERELPVALGRGGIGKSQEGDGKTPLGTYPLGPPRPSRRFHHFIPIQYPTRAQIRHGLTGGEVGIHGPDRRTSFLGRWSVAVDWTRGCIAVADIDQVVAWVSAHHPLRVTIV
jgi:murein L,D-transpeptidase YafK